MLKPDFLYFFLLCGITMPTQVKVTCDQSCSNWCTYPLCFPPRQLRVSWYLRQGRQHLEALYLESAKDMPNLNNLHCFKTIVLWSFL